jgi:hypothetical protein
MLVLRAGSSGAAVVTSIRAGNEGSEGENGENLRIMPEQNPRAAPATRLAGTPQLGL